MLVRCNKRHICTKYMNEIEVPCSHVNWHEYTSRCNDWCIILKDKGIDLDGIYTDCTETNQPDFINEEEMII